MMEFREGNALIKVPEFEKITAKSRVFYNPDMAYDRELSLNVFRASGKKEVCDAFSGSGIRAILYALEGGIVTANDVNPHAIDLIHKNAQLNKVTFTIKNEDANILFRESEFEVIDVDPFGSPVHYLDSVMHGLRNDSLLFVTATDIEALCGFAKKACLRKYGIKTVRTPFAKELGVRILITTILREGSKYGFGFSVLLSYWRRHYLRVFLRARRSKKAALLSMNMVNPVFYCICGHFSTKIQEKCPLCGRDTHFISPVYLGKIKENTFCEKIESPLAKKLSYELDTPFYYDTHFLAGFHGFQPPRIDELIEKLREDTFLASRTIFCPTGVKTTASLDHILKKVK